MHALLFGLLALLTAAIAEAALFAQEDPDLHSQATRARAGA